MRHLLCGSARLLLTAALTSAVAGCAAAPATPLKEAHDRAVRRLSSQCLWQHEGERAVFGGYAVLMACRRWAEDRVRVRMPE